MVLKPNDQPADGVLNTPSSPITGGGIYGSAFGVAVDKLGYIWAGNFGWGDPQYWPSSGSVTKLSTVTLPSGSVPKGIAVDSLGNAWVAAGGTSTVHVINSGGTIVGSYAGQGLNGP